MLLAAAVVAARRPAIFCVPHITLDLRERSGELWSRPSSRLRARGAPNRRLLPSFGRRLSLLPARRRGAAATGHYARRREHRGRLLLARAADPSKDQSYMLARLDPRYLDRVWFPLGDWTKEDTRARARKAGLAVAARAESQEACFLAGGDYRDFLVRRGLAPAMCRSWTVRP